MKEIDVSFTSGNLYFSWFFDTVAKRISSIILRKLGEDIVREHITYTDYDGNTFTLVEPETEEERDISDQTFRGEYV